MGKVATGGRILLSLFALAAGAGCREEWGAERFATTTVRGAILVGGRPVPGGFVEIIPGEGTRGNLRSGPIAADGTFRLDRVPVGAVSISLSRLPIRAIPGPAGPVDARAFAPNSSAEDRVPLRRTIPAAPTTLPPIDLIDEVARRRPVASPRRRRKRAGSKRGGGRSKAAGPAVIPPDGGETVPSGDLTLRVVYRDAAGTVHLDWPLERLATAIGDPRGCIWVDVADLGSAHNREVEAILRDTFRFHPLAIEDALQDVHVPRVDDWKDYLYLVVNTLDFHPETDEVQLHELDLFLGSNFLLTYHHEPNEALVRYRRWIELEPAERLGSGPSYLLYHLLDDVVDRFLPAIEHLDTAIDDAQDEVFDHATPTTLRRIFQVKSSAVQLNRVVAPMREVLNRLARDPYPQIAVEHRVYFRDVYDHLVRVHDIVEGLRDLINGALDTYLSVVSNRTNDIMKVLTLLNVMFLPMTFLAGFFGMNFFGDTLMFTAPQLPRAALFWGTVTLMVLTPPGMWLFARARGWF